MIVRIINSAYDKEVVGPEAFRKGPTVTEAQIRNLLTPTEQQDDEGAAVASGYRWLLLEVPCGMNIEADGTVLGVCCYTTDGLCRKNGNIHKSS